MAKTPDKFSYADDDEVIVSPCASCIHKFHWVDACEAFPEEIPMDILLAKHDHKTSFPGDHGIHYEARPRVRED